MGYNKVIGYALKSPANEVGQQRNVWVVSELTVVARVFSSNLQYTPV